MQNLISSYQQKSISSSSSEYEKQYETKLVMNKSLCELGLSEFQALDEFRQQLASGCSSHKFDLDRPENLEDASFSILFYNQAVCFYLDRQYSKCIKIIDKLYYQFNELLDGKLMRKVSLMFVDLLLQQRQVNFKE